MDNLVRKYFEALPEELKSRLETIRDAFQEAKSEAELTMKYWMPTFEWNGE